MKLREEELESEFRVAVGDKERRKKKREKNEGGGGLEIRLLSGRRENNKKKRKLKFHHHRPHRELKATDATSAIRSLHLSYFPGLSHALSVSKVMFSALSSQISVTFGSEYWKSLLLHFFRGLLVECLVYSGFVRCSLHQYISISWVGLFRFCML